jgi:hypothetical protein
MIEDFENVKKQLSELADVVNRFKSEAVQLRIIELILGDDHVDAEEVRATPPAPRKKRRRTSGNKTAAKSSGAAEKSKTKKNGATRSGNGAVSTLVAVYDKAFFKTPRVIGDIVSHCEVNLARKIKASDISGKLGRMVRNGELTHTKNADGQYEYQNA